LPRQDVLIENAIVLDGLGGKLEQADVLLQDGLVAALGQDLKAGEGVVRIDAQGRWLTPGLIDIHSHNGTYSLPLTSQSFDTLDISELSDPNAAATWIEHAINVQDLAFTAALRSGVTTLQVLPGSVPLFGGRTVVLKPIPASTIFDMKFPGAPQGIKMACGENPKSHFGEDGRAPTSRQGEVAMMRSAFLRAQKYRQEWQVYRDKPGRSTQPERDLQLDTLAAVLGGELQVHLHCYRADDIAVMLALADEFGFRSAAIHHATEAYKVPELLREHASCAAVWADWWGYKPEASDAIRENAAFVDAAGACAVMHSDGPLMGQKLNLEAGKALAAGQRAGLPLGPEHAIRWLTSNAAMTLGLQDRIGQLSAGYNADVVIWSHNPFSIYAHAEQVFIDGALVFDRNDAGRQPLSDAELGIAARELQP
jgi:imidazolonepropionase-like amidohydrolase